MASWPSMRRSTPNFSFQACPRRRIHHSSNHCGWRNPGFTELHRTRTTNCRRIRNSLGGKKQCLESALEHLTHLQHQTRWCPPAPPKRSTLACGFSKFSRTTRARKVPVRQTAAPYFGCCPVLGRPWAICFFALLLYSLGHKAIRLAGWGGSTKPHEDPMFCACYP